MGAQELCICYRTLLQHTTPSSCHHAGHEGNEGHEGDEGHEEGYEAPRNEGCRRGGTDEGHESNEGHEGHEEGHEAPCDEGSRGGGTNEGHEGDEGNESHEGHEEGDEGNESHEGHEGNEEVIALTRTDSERHRDEELWRGTSSGSLSLYNCWRTFQ